MSAYIDKFQAYVAELETMAPGDYSNGRKKMLLLNNIKSASGIQHLIQNCRDDYDLTYEQCVVYLCRNAILIDFSNTNKTPTKLMHVAEI